MVILQCVTSIEGQCVGSFPAELSSYAVELSFMYHRSPLHVGVHDKKFVKVL